MLRLGASDSYMQHMHQTSIARDTRKAKHDVISSNAKLTWTIAFFAWK